MQNIQRTEVVNSGDRFVVSILRSFDLELERVRLAFNSFVCSLLHYCIHCWSLYYKYNIEKLDKMHRRVTKNVPRLRYKPYEERLEEHNLSCLTKHGLRGDLIIILKSLEEVSKCNPFKYHSKLL